MTDTPNPQQSQSLRIDPKAVGQNPQAAYQQAANQLLDVKRKAGIMDRVLGALGAGGGPGPKSRFVMGQKGLGHYDLAPDGGMSTGSGDGERRARLDKNGKPLPHHPLVIPRPHDDRPRWQREGRSEPNDQDRKIMMAAQQKRERRMKRTRG